MGRAVLLLASGTLSVFLAVSVALAATVDCADSVEILCVGTKNDDTLHGDEGWDQMHGRAGVDQLFGNGGGDHLLGDHGADTIKGGAGEDSASFEGGQGIDKIYGEGGNDNLEDYSHNPHRKVDDKNLLDGGEGNDVLYGWTKLYGGPGDDTLEIGWTYVSTRTTLDGGPGLDTIRGGRSADTIYAQDGERHQISCNRNKDTVYYDKNIDVVNSNTCERRITQPPPEG